MIKFVRGNIFASKAHTLVNTVNCVGVMGKGLAKEFKDRYPQMFAEYQKACRHGEVRSGRPYLYRELGRIVLCFPTKDNWKGPSKYEFVEAGLKAIAANYAAWKLESIALPALGCGLGGLEWRRVRAMMEKELGRLPIEIEVYEPGEADARIGGVVKKKPEIKRVKISLALAIVGEVIFQARRRMSEEERLGKLLLQKMVFFAQFAGAPIKLRFDKYQFGPYDHRLNHMVERLEGLFVRDASASWKMSDLRVLDGPAWEEATSFVADDLKEYQGYIERSVSLLVGQSLDEVELLATSMYAWGMLLASGEPATTEQVVDYIAGWSAEKRRKFSAQHVDSALQRLSDSGWLGPIEPEAGSTAKGQPLRSLPDFEAAMAKQ